MFAEISPYLDLALCPIRAEPWSCARQKSARVLDLWDDELHVQWQKLKVEADRQMNATIERRGYSASELPIREKPSTLLKKIEIGTKYMKEYLAETMDGFLGREYEYLQSPKEASSADSENADYDDETDAETETETGNDAESENETDAGDSGDTGEEEGEENDASASGEQETSGDAEADEDDDDEEEEAEDEAENENVPIVTSVNALPAANAGDVKNTVFSEDSSTSGAVEFIELEDGEQDAAGAVKKPGGGGGGKRKKNKTKRKKKGQQQQQPATLVVVQAAPEHHEVESSSGHGHGHGGGGGGGHGGGGHGGGGGKPFKRKSKRGKRKRKGQQSTVMVQESDDHLGLELLDDLVESGLGGGLGGKRKHKNYGRSNGVTRGKKKKKRKAFAKLALAGTLIKAKIELLLKILGAHLQIKFFAIALIGLLINIARFWIDVKRGGTPSKVVYVEHAHHQHHYEDHGEDWGEQGSYWKRSLQTDPSIEDTDSSTDSYQLRPYGQQLQQQPQDAHYLAYRNQYQWQ
ncbi:hypothetical protein KR222_005868 [Zaprionus bogoriensis]|nr:hypothetical protein KR222_005868 [Zaprionus bogoriensis]